MQKITWQLKDNGSLLINNENVDANVSTNEISYQDEFGTHKIDLINQTYERVGNDNIMIIDFQNKILTFKFDLEKLSYDIEANFMRNENVITLTYVLGDDQKEIIITIEEDL